MGFNEFVAKLNRNEELSEQEERRFKAITSSLVSQGGEGRKRVMAAMTGNDAASRMLATYATSGDTSIMTAVGKKNVYLEQYTRDLAAGRAVDENNRAVDYESWLTTERSDGSTNQEFVTSNVLDKDDALMGQSSDAIKLALGATDHETGQAVISDERRESILKNNALVASNSKGAGIIENGNASGSDNRRSGAINDGHGRTIEKSVTLSATDSNGNKTTKTGRVTDKGKFINNDGTVEDMNDLGNNGFERI